MAKLRRYSYTSALSVALFLALLVPFLVSASPPVAASDPVALAAVAIRDKGEIPLDRPDSKPAGALDPVTDNLAVAFLDLNAHEAVIWWQPCGCWLPKEYYGNVNLVGWVGFVHSGPDGRHMKILGRTWDENGGDVPGKHFVVIDLGELP